MFMPSYMETESHPPCAQTSALYNKIACFNIILIYVITIQFSMFLLQHLHVKPLCVCVGEFCQGEI